MNGVIIIRIFYDETLLGPGYVIYDPKTKNFFKIYYEWYENNLLEINLYAHAEKLQMNSSLDNEFQGIVFNIVEDDPLYYVIKKVYDYIGSNKIESKNEPTVFYNCFKIEQKNEGEDNNFFRLIFFKKKILKAKKFGLTTDIIVTPKMNEGLIKFYNELGKYPLQPLKDATFLSAFCNTDEEIIEASHSK